MVKLDIKDKKLLYYLSQNSRLSYTQLSKRIGLSKNSVKYRIERLQKEKVITKFASVINLGAIDYTTVTLLLKFNEDIYEKPEIIDYLKNHKFADWMVTLSGQWDIFIEFAINGFFHLNKLISEITEHFGNVLNIYQLFLSRETLRVEHLIADFYQDIKLKEPVQPQRTISVYKINDVDRKILKILNEDSSLPYLQIAQRINSTLDVVRYRIKKLIQKEVIIKFFSEVSLPKLGYTEYLYWLKLKNISKEKIEKLKARIATDKNITYAYTDLTGFNIMFVCAFKSPEGIDHLSRSLRKTHADIFEKQEFFIIKEQILFDLFPKGLC